mmetsp:Transcript_12585/g.22070  ORF Transcript_12585/g.22070 Transcript_12585/m.22070 type:complete len:460 (-) Transcript_12585:171-1550(-)
MSTPLHTPQSTSSPTQSSSPSSQLDTAMASGNANMIDGTKQPMRNYDGTEMRDVQSNIVFKSQFLSTHPVKTDCKERVGYGGKKFTYVSGDGVIRTMNAIFGHGGWSTQITMERNVLCEQDERKRWTVGYLASVRVTILNGVSHEDCGSGEGIDPNKVKAHEKALKSAITDAMKRAARHFGERLGNALYVKGNGIRTAPRTNKDALLELERKDAISLFGDQAVLRANHSNMPCQSPENKKLSPSLVTKIATAVTTATTSNALQKENWPQNRVVGQTTTTIAANSFNTRPSPNVVVAAAQQPASMGPTVLPSPIASSTAHHHGTVHTHAVINNAGVRTGNPSPASNNNNNNMYQPPNHLMMNAPQPPNLMAPPPRPMYNPGGGGSGGAQQYNGGGINVNNLGGRRGPLDGTGNEHGNGGHNNTPTSYMNMNNNNGDNNAKRQKVNPYNSSNSNSKKRMSV